MDPMDALASAWAFVYQGYDNFTRNTIYMYNDLTIFKVIRMIAIIGAYILLRPYLVKIGNKIQESQMKKIASESDDKGEGKAKKAKISPNMMREGGGKGVRFADEEESSEDESIGKGGVKWGKAARKKARLVQRLLEEEEERRLKEDDIMEQLVDYEDGW